MDTDVVSYLFRGDPRAEAYRPAIDGRILVISFMTVAEMEYGARNRGWSEHRLAALRRHLGSFVVYPFRTELCRAWAEVMDAAARHGCRLECADAWVAATARLHALPLVTNNSRDFRGIRDLVQVVSPIAGDPEEQH